MKIRLLGLSMCLVFAGLSWAEPELKGTPDDLKMFFKHNEDIVYLTADATLEIQAERAIVMISVITEKEMLEGALKENHDLRQTIFQKLGAANIPKDRISGTRFSSTPQYGIFSKRTKSYKVENLLKVTIENETEFQKVAGVIDSSDHVHYRKLEFEHQDKDAMELKVLSMAFEKLQKKKELYEGRLNLRLVPKKFVDQRVFGTSQVRRMVVDESAYDNALNSSVAKSYMSPQVEENSTIFGVLTFNATVSVEYAVTGK